MKTLDCADYQALHHFSVERPSLFWAALFQRLSIQFETPSEVFCDLSRGVRHPRWLTGATLNIVDSCFQAAPNQTAVVTKTANRTLHRWSFQELEQFVNRVANGLLERGLKPGDRIAIDMPMNVASVAIYLGILKMGGTVVSIADSFSSNEIQTRLEISNTQAIFTQDVIVRSGKCLPLYQKVIEANAPQAFVCPSDAMPKTTSVTLRAKDCWFEDLLSDHPHFTAHQHSAMDTANILFSSGTTGTPKAIPWTHLSAIKSASDAHLHHDIHPGDVLCWPTNLGWMMGPWLIYAALLNQATMALYDDAPLTKTFGKFVQDSKTTMLGVVPSLVKAWKSSRCMEGLDWRCIRCFSSTGECSNPTDMLYLMHLANYRPIIEYCGGTEIAGAYITSTFLHPQAPATLTTPCLGLDFLILNEDGQVSSEGEVAIISPSFGLSTELLNANHNAVYFEGMPTGPNGECLRRHSDQIERLTDVCFRTHGRSDDAMNLGGIKTSSDAIERVLVRMAGINEVAAIAVAPKEGGPSQLIIYTAKDKNATSNAFDHTLKECFQKSIDQNLNPLFKIKEVIVLEHLPRTASNKIIRKTLRERYHDNRSNAVRPANIESSESAP